MPETPQLGPEQATFNTEAPKRTWDQLDPDEQEAIRDRLEELERKRTELLELMGADEQNTDLMSHRAWKGMRGIEAEHGGLRETHAAMEINTSGAHPDRQDSGQ